MRDIKIPHWREGYQFTQVEEAIMAYSRWLEDAESDNSDINKYIYQKIEHNVVYKRIISTIESIASKGYPVSIVPINTKWMYDNDIPTTCMIERQQFVKFKFNVEAFPKRFVYKLFKLLMKYGVHSNIHHGNKYSYIYLDQNYDVYDVPCKRTNKDRMYSSFTNALNKVVKSL